MSKISLSMVIKTLVSMNEHQISFFRDQTFSAVKIRNEVVRGAVQEISHSGKCRGASETHLGMFVRRSSEDSAQKVLSRSDCVDEPTACAAPPTICLALKFL